MTVSKTPHTPTLYKREGDYIPRIAAVHDLCGYGKCSLGVAIPVLSAAGADVCPVPTGLFSSHTAFPGWYMHDTTDILADYLAAWKGIDVEIDAVYSGFLTAFRAEAGMRPFFSSSLPRYLPGIVLLLFFAGSYL